MRFCSTEQQTKSTASIERTKQVDHAHLRLNHAVVQVGVRVELRRHPAGELDLVGARKEVHAQHGCHGDLRRGATKVEGALRDIGDSRRV